jgi:hypothetical protein
MNFSYAANFYRTLSNKEFRLSYGPGSDLCRRDFERNAKHIVEP